MAKKWIKKAVRKPGRLGSYLKKKFGKVAFSKDGNIKIAYINKALADCKRTGKCSKSVISMLNLGKRFAKHEFKKRGK